MRFIPVILLFSLLSCESKPKVIVEDTVDTSSQPAVAAGNPQMTVAGQGNAMDTDVHQVQAIEILQAERYTYMRVIEQTDTFWIAASKMEAQKGRNYFYRGGLLKTNFESQEFNRTFDKIYLVSQIIDASAHPGGNAPSQSMSPEVADVDLKKVAGRVSLDKLLSSPNQYAGKTIVVGGKVSKVNNGIMGKNWVHIQDGTSAKGKKSELTVTTQDNVPTGATVVFEGKIYINKDFGAGYRYDIIMEEATMKR